MDNDTKHMLVETLNWDQSSDIKIETSSLHSPNINPIKNVWGIIRKNSREMDSKILMNLNNM